MENQEILKAFEEFSKNYDFEKSKLIWSEKSKQFRDFWNNKIMNKEVKSISENEIDEIVKILDKNAKGNTKNDVAVARAMIPQGVWRRMFIELKQNKNLQEHLNKILTSAGETIISFVDELYKINEGKKNSLTGKSANAINDLLFAYSPLSYISVISLNDRKRIIEFFNFEGSPDFEKDAVGKKIYMSNISIINGFKKMGIYAEPRSISDFIYIALRSYWKTEPESNIEQQEILADEGETSDTSLFYMEKELENFLITNWDKTELGKEYDLIVENGEVVSQQYLTDIGKIDILAIDKKSKQYVVIELKRNQTSDDTVGQLTRYMGWLEENKTNGKPTKGIIIAASYDNKLYYALKKVKDVEVYCYQVDFKLKEFKKV